MQTYQWLPETLLYLEKNHIMDNPQSATKVAATILLSRSQFQIKSIETSNNATFLLTHGGQVYYFGEMITDDSMSDIISRSTQN